MCMDRLTWNWCERNDVLFQGCISFCLPEITCPESESECDYEEINYGCSDMACRECWSLHYPAKREGCWITISMRHYCYFCGHNLYCEEPYKDGFGCTNFISMYPQPEP